MDIYDQIRGDLRARNAAGMTYKRFEAELGVCGSYVQRIVSGLSDPQKMTLETFFKLFPSAQVSLTGASALAPACSSSELERVRMEAERTRLAHERRELELERRIFELEKALAELERPYHPPRDERPSHPYRVEPAPSTLSPSTK